jgi:predicted regulator of Ras-like GTPase activity (Roadblock/LC7/MglB family)
VDYCLKQKGAAIVSTNRLCVVQGYDAPAEETIAARKAAAQTGAGAIIVARARLDQSYEPRIFRPK